MYSGLRGALFAVVLSAYSCAANTHWLVKGNGSAASIEDVGPLVGALAARHNFEVQEQNTEIYRAWKPCYVQWDQRVGLCWRIVEGNAQLQLTQNGGSNFNEFGKKVRSELSDSLVAHFGQDHVLLCDSDRKSNCDSLYPTRQ